MAFSANPLALSVPETTFESWLRSNGYFEVLDRKTTQLHSLSTSDSAAAGTSSPSDEFIAATIVQTGFFTWAFSYVGTLISLVTINPFSKLANDDFSRETPSWTLGFVGFFDSYSFPSSPSQARLRVHENVKRYARNYATLFILFFACSLYQIPVALVGLVSSLALWDLFRYCGDHWGLDRHPVIQQCLIRVAQCGTAVILFFCNVQAALLYALGVSYAVMMLHASFRKLTPVVVQHGRGR